MPALQPARHHQSLKMGEVSYDTEGPVRTERSTSHPIHNTWLNTRRDQSIRTAAHNDTKSERYIITLMENRKQEKKGKGQKDRMGNKPDSPSSTILPQIFSATTMTRTIASRPSVPVHSPPYPRTHQQCPGLDKMLGRAFDPCRAEFRHATCELDNRAKALRRSSAQGKRRRRARRVATPCSRNGVRVRRGEYWFTKLQTAASAVACTMRQSFIFLCEHGKQRCA
jgi:hypothetical protein